MPAGESATPPNSRAVPDGPSCGRASVIAGVVRTIGRKCSIIRSGCSGGRVADLRDDPGQTLSEPVHLARRAVLREFPTWKTAMFNTVEERKKMFANPDVRRKLRTEAIEDRSPSVFPRRWDVIFVDHVKLSKNKGREGKSVDEVAKAQGKDGLDCFLDLSLEEDLETRFVHTNTQGDPQAVCEILKHPSVMVGQSD